MNLKILSAQKWVAIVLNFGKDTYPNLQLIRFITVAGKWVYSGRQWVLKLYSDRAYDLLMVKK